MKIKTKLYLGFASILAIMAVLFGLSINTFNQTNRNINEDLRIRCEKIRFSNTIHYETDNISIYFRDLVLLDTASEDLVL